MYSLIHNIDIRTYIVTVESTPLAMHYYAMVQCSYLMYYAQIVLIRKFVPHFVPSWYDSYIIKLIKFYRNMVISMSTNQLIVTILMQHFIHFYV